MFYSLSPIITDEIKYPQVECPTPFTIQQLNPWKELTIIPTLKFKLKNKAKFTDLLSTTISLGNDLLVSSRLLEIFKHHRILSYNDIPSIVTSKGEVREYHWIHFYGPNMVKLIDFPKSIFVETEWTFPKGPIKIESFEHYLALKNNDGLGAFGVSVDKVVLNKNFNLDLFFIFPFDSTVFISDALRSEILNKDLSGLCMEKTERIITN